MGADQDSREPILDHFYDKMSVEKMKSWIKTSSKTAVRGPVFEAYFNFWSSTDLMTNSRFIKHKGLQIQAFNGGDLSVTVEGLENSLKKQFKVTNVSEFSGIA